MLRVSKVVEEMDDEERDEDEEENDNKGDDYEVGDDFFYKEDEYNEEDDEDQEGEEEQKRKLENEYEVENVNKKKKKTNEEGREDIGAVNIVPDDKWDIVRCTEKNALELTNTLSHLAYQGRDTSFYDEASAFADKLVAHGTDCSKAASILEEVHSIVREPKQIVLPNQDDTKAVDDKRRMKASYILRTPFTDSNQNKIKKVHVSKVGKKRVEMVDDDDDFQIIGRRNFVSTPAREISRDFDITVEKLEAAKACYKSVTGAHYNILVKYAIDKPKAKEFPESNGFLLELWTRMHVFWLDAFII